MVVVNVDVATASPATVSFGIPIIVGPNLGYNQRLKFYTSLLSVAADLHLGENAPEYIALQTAFSGAKRLSRVGIGYIANSKVITFTGTYTAGTLTAVVNGTTYTQTYSSDKATTLAALLVKIEANTAVSATSAIVGDIMTLVPNTGYNLAANISVASLTGTMAITNSYTATETITQALTAIAGYDNTWFGFGITTKTDNDILLAAAWAEANKKLFGCSEYNSDVNTESLAADADSLAKQLKTLGYAFTFYVADILGESTYPEFGVFAKIFPETPGTFDIQCKSLPGIEVSSYTDGDLANILSKNANCYIDIGGLGVFRDGKVVSGELIWVVQFVEWLKARIQQAVLGYKARVPKAAYNTAGIQAIASVISGPLQEGQDAGGISPTEYNSEKVQIGGWYVDLPKFEDVPFADKADHILRNVNFTAYLNNSIHYVVINGTVTY